MPIVMFRSSEIQHGRDGISFPNPLTWPCVGSMQCSIFIKHLLRPHTLALSWGQSCFLTGLPVLPLLVCEGTVSQ